MRQGLKIFTFISSLLLMILGSGLSASATTFSGWSLPIVATTNLSIHADYAQSGAVTMIVYIENGKAYSNVSSDNGNNWGTPTQVSDNSVTVNGIDVTEITAGGFAVAYSTNQAGIKIHSSNAAGNVWSSALSLAASQPDEVQIASLANNKVAVSARAVVSGEARVIASVSNTGITSFAAPALLSPSGGNSWLPRIASNQGVITVAWTVQSGQLTSRFSSDEGATWSQILSTNVVPSVTDDLELTACGTETVASLISYSSTGSQVLAASSVSPTSWANVVSQNSNIATSFGTVCLNGNRLFSVYADSNNHNAYWASSQFIGGAWQTTSYAQISGVTIDEIQIAPASDGTVAVYSNTYGFSNPSVISGMNWSPVNGWSAQVSISQTTNMPIFASGFGTPGGAIFSWVYQTNNTFLTVGPRNTLTFTPESVPSTPALAQTGVPSEQNAFSLEWALGIVALTLGFSLLAIQKRRSSKSPR